MKILSRVLAPLLLTLVCVAQLTQWIDLTNTDLGRHLKNGELIVHGPWDEKWAVLQTNHYSFAAGETPFVNHHWLTGVVFFLLWKAFSFTGLTLFYTGLVTGSVLVAYWAAVRASNRWIAAGLAALAVPMIAWRWEIRPEGFTYLLLAVVYAVLAAWFYARLSSRWLWVLPPLMFLWINLHIGFVVGFFLIGIFGWKVLLADGLALRGRLAQLCAVGAAAVLAALLNPSGLTGLLYPFSILSKTTGYPVAELASLSVIRARGLWAWEYELFLALLAISVAVFALRGRSISWPDAALLAILGALSVLQVRNIPLFLLIMIPQVAGTVQSLIPPAPAPSKKQKAPPQPLQWPRYAAAGCIGIGLLCAIAVYRERSATAHWGLLPGTSAPINFLKANAIGGPIFNDFDIGGYLILNSQQVFVDGRPEAYPAGFFDQGYMPMLSADSAWQAWDKKYHFNLIVLSMQDGYPGVEQFILSRVRDDQWAPVFTDSYSIIFARRTEANASVIAKYQIPRDRFR
jgi:hypothetical protein